jgi:cyclic-di-GMP-binding protein
VKNSFFLVIPAQESRPERLKEFETKAVEQWLFELPTANPGLATRLLQDFITDFNAVKMPLQLRLDVLEQIRPKVLIIEDYLRSRLLKSAFPKEDNDLKILQVLALIEREYTIGYWIVLKELANRPVSWFQGKNLALSLQRCIKGLSSVVVSHFIMGLPIPDWVWIDLHSLYKLSVKLKKDTARVADNTNVNNKSSSPDECYRQIALLSLAQPTGLMQKEIPQVYNFIETLLPYFSLSAKPIEGQQLQFVLLIDEDKSPFAQSPMYTNFDSGSLYLDLTKLYKAFEKKNKFINPSESRFTSIHVLKNHEERPSAELLDYLEQRWSGIDLHQEANFKDRLDRYISIGMGPAHSIQGDESQQGWSSGRNETEHEILAHSESDRLLFCVFEKTGVLSVGNIISCRKIDQPLQKCALGVVNELIVTKQNNKICFGIQLLAKRYHAVSYCMTNANEKEPSQYYKGLFYNSGDDVVGTSFIVVDNFMLKEDDMIKMQMGHETIHLLLKNKKNIGLGYWQFECQRIAARPDKSKNKKGYDFI